VDKDKRCEKMACTVKTFSSEWAAREYLSTLDAQVVEEAELLADYWSREPWPYYPQKSYKKEYEELMDLHHFTGTDEPVGKLVSPKYFLLQHIYELGNGDLILHGVCQREIRVIGSDEEHVITFRRIIDLYNEYLMSVRAHFLLRISKEGQVKWLRGISAFEPASDGSYVLHVSQAGEVTMVGASYDNPVRLGVGSSTERIFPGGGMSYFAVRFTADGEVAWCGEIGRGWVGFHALTTTQDNRVFLLGQGRNDTQFYLDEGKYEVYYGRWFVSEFAFPVLH